MNRCDICLEETCKGTHNCNCDTCSHRDECYRVLHAIIRITNKCTQTCEHCAFSSSPDSHTMMSVEEAKKIGQFMIANGVPYINVMGGEFICNPDWYEIVDILVSSTSFMRIVSNGDWATSEEIKEKLSLLIKKYPEKIRISISKDKYHTNKHVDKAEEWLKSQKVIYNIGEESNMPEDSIVPVGRGSLSYGVYSSLSCYCHNPVHMYSFLIDEVGKIYKCGFGVWNYAQVDDYLEGGFRERFKTFNKKFYSCWVPNCASCIRCASRENDNMVSKE